MGCSSCSTGKDGKPNGCKSNGGCSSGGCNRLNTYDWLASRDIRDNDGFDLVEVSFKSGAKKNFYHNSPDTRALIGDMVVVEASNGYDIGRISLTGELVRLQMKKKKVAEDSILQNVIRLANERDLERLYEARNLEKSTMIRARAISRTLDLDMKVGDVEYQGDKRKATFYYTAEGRVDFRELIRHFAKEFKVKIEMRQIGARQESARIGGVGSCGRELCCSTWLTDFKSVSTAAARYQNLAINQSKLSGQCGRLKCCLNYELDTYMDALEEFPKNVDKLKTEVGTAILIKTDIFKGLMFYVYDTGNGRGGKFYPLELDRVKEIKALNTKGQVPPDLVDLASLVEEETLIDYDISDVTGVVELPPEEKKKKRRNRNRNRNRNQGNKGGNSRNQNSAQTKSRQSTPKPGQKQSGNKPVDANKHSGNNKNRRQQNQKNKEGDKKKDD